MITSAAAGASGSSSSNSSSPSLSPPPDSSPARHYRDVFWLALFLLHLVALAAALALLGVNRFTRPDRLNIDRFNLTAAFNQTVPPDSLNLDRFNLTETFWPMYGVAGAVGAALALGLLLGLGRWAGMMMRVSVHILTTYLAVVSVFCFWGDHFVWGVAFATGAGLHFLYVMSVMDRFPFTMLVLQKAVKMVCDLPEVIRVAYIFLMILLVWMALWSFGAAGVVALSMDINARWWLLVVLSVSLFWTGAVLCNTVHIIVSGMVFLVLIHGGRKAATMPPNPLMKSLRYAVTTSFGSICYGSLFTAAIRTLRWEIRGVRSKIGNNECLLCCIDFLFHLVETLVRFFNKYAYVQMGLAVVVVESAVTSIYVCFAEDPSLIQRWDAEFFNQMSEALHLRLQYRSARARQMTDGRFDQIPDSPPI